MNLFLITLLLVFWTLRAEVCSRFIVEIEKKNYILNEPLPDSTYLNGFPFAYIQPDPEKNENCSQTCETTGDFDHCAFPSGEFHAPGFLIAYNEKNEKILRKIKSGYSIIPTISNDICFCQKKGVVLTYKDEYQDMRNAFLDFDRLVTQTVDVTLDFLLDCIRRKKQKDRLFEPLGHMFNETFMPMLAWCRGVGKMHFIDKEGNFSTVVLEELVNKVETLQSTLKALDSGIAYRNEPPVVVIHARIHEMVFSKPLSILYALKYRVERRFVGLKDHSC